MRAGYDEVVLLTGFPSFVARAVLAELVSSGPRTLVFAVVRAKFAAEANALLDELPLDQRHRVVLLEGDAASIDFGLSAAELREVVRDVDRIHHAAHASFVGVDRATAEHTNIDGTREAIEVAAACRNLSCLVLHSTALVAGDRTGLVMEDALEAGQRFRNVVEETRARAEKMMRAAMPRVPIAVVRPSTVIGDSRTGEVDRFDGPYLLVLLSVASPVELQLPLLGRGEVPLNLVPIDYVARAACALGRDERARGHTFHLVDPAPLTARRVFEAVARASGRRVPRGSIPANLAKALLRAPGLERVAQSPRAFVDSLVTPVTYDARRASELLAGTGIECPPFESYVDKVVEFVEQRVREKRAKKAAVKVDDPLV
jgi:thioester reductase-like protein